MFKCWSSENLPSLFLSPLKFCIGPLRQSAVCLCETLKLSGLIDCLKIKVKCTLVQALRLCTGRTAHRGSGGIALLFLYHGTRMG